MTTGRLPDHEQRILDDMERALRRDRRLERRSPAWTVAVLFAVSVALLVTGILTCDLAVIWAFTGVWSLTLFAGFRLLCRRAES